MGFDLFAVRRLATIPLMLNRTFPNRPAVNRGLDPLTHSSLTQPHVRGGLPHSTPLPSFEHVSIPEADSQVKPSRLRVPPTPYCKRNDARTTEGGHRRRDLRDCMCRMRLHSRERTNRKSVAAAALVRVPQVVVYLWACPVCTAR